MAEFLPAFLAAHGPFGIQAIADLWKSSKVNTEVFAETLIWLGKTPSPETHQARLSLLGSALDDAVASIRDAATIGLTSLGDQAAVAYLGRALEREQNTWVRQALQQAIEDLSV